METLAQHFEATYAKKKVALTGTQLLATAREKKLKVTPAEVYAYLRERVPEVAPFGRRDPVRHHQTIGVARYGVYFVDYGEFHRDWAGSNSGCTGFLVAVENLTNRLYALETRGKSTAQWTDSLRKFFELTRDVSTVYSDRDSVATSPKFREEMRSLYGIEWHFLKKGHKSYLAERYIGLLKTKLSQALAKVASERGEGAPPPRRWVDYLAPICDEYNAEKIAGTSYRRRAVQKGNFDHFLEQLFKTDDAELLFNAAKAGPFERESWNRRVFRYDLGDRVLLARSANWKESGEKLGAFGKATMRGAFGAKSYTVSGRQLRVDRSRKRMVPVYALAEMGPAMHFYERELRRVGYGSGRRDEAVERVLDAPPDVERANQ